MRRSTLVASALSALAFLFSVDPLHATAGFCPSQTDPTIVYCEDFSGPNPLGAYTVNNPISAGYSAYSSISIINQTLVFRDSLGFAVANVVSNRTLNWQDSSLQSSIKFATNPALRNLMGIFWVSGTPGQSYISWDLQLDEKNAYLIIVLNGKLLAFQPVAYPALQPNQSYVMRLDIEGNQKVRGYIDDVLVLTANVDLSGFPPLQNIAFGGDSYNDYLVDQVYEYAVVKHIYRVCLLYDSAKGVHSGATLPIKLQLCDANGNDMSSPSITLHVTSVTQVSTSTSGQVQDAGNANPDNDFRYDAGLGPAGGYIFNLKTTGLTTGTYNLNFTLTGASAAYSVPFQVK
jgi:hypothetical protein